MVTEDPLSDPKGTLNVLSPLIHLDEARKHISNIVDANARAASYLVLGAAMVELTRIRAANDRNLST